MPSKEVTMVTDVCSSKTLALGLSHTHTPTHQVFCFLGFLHDRVLSADYRPYRTQSVPSIRDALPDI